MADPQRIDPIVQRARNGDRAAFDELIRLHRFRLLGFIERRVKFYVGPPFDVEELLQETVCRALESIDHFTWQGRNSFFTWLCGIAKHTVFKSIEKAQKGRQAGDAESIPTPKVTPSAVFRRDDRFARLQEAVEALSPDHRKVIQLARIEGLKVKEIAERMNRSTNAVVLLLARALRQLKKEFGDTESLHLPKRQLNWEEIDDAR